MPIRMCWWSTISQSFKHPLTCAFRWRAPYYRPGTVLRRICPMQLLQRYFCCCAALRAAALACVHGASDDGQDAHACDKKTGKNRSLA